MDKNSAVIVSVLGLAGIAIGGAFLKKKLSSNRQ